MSVIARTTTGRVPLVLALVALVAGVLVSGASARRASAAPGGPGSAFVRVNQVGYPAPGSKRAYLIASAAETGATFAVKSSGGTSVFSAGIGPDLGDWSSAYPHVYAMDFTSVTAAGSYTIDVTGPIAATSPAFAIGTGAKVYAQALKNSLSFYRAERDGPKFIASALRTAPAHLNDQNAMTYLTPKANSGGYFSGDLTPLGVTMNASGGWWDAGDYLKFVQTTSYTVDLLLVGVRDFPNLMGSGSSGSNFTAEARFGADWLLRMWDDKTQTLYYQVGIGSGNAKTVGDHDIWRLPQDDDTYGGTDPAFRYIRNRPVFRAGPPGSSISPNLAGRDAAALALAYQVFKTSAPKFANRCLLAAVHIFELANTSPGKLLTVIPYSFYPEAEWRDDLELGATELYYALAGGGTLPAGLPHDSAYYLQQAAHWANAYITGPNDASDSLNLYDVSALAHYELHRAITMAGNPASLETTQDALLADMKKQLDIAVAQAATDPFGFGFPWARWDTTTHGAGLSVMASMYDALTGTNAYADFAGRWLANILGANAWGSSFIVGDGTTFPHCMQHQVTNLIGSLDGSPPILAGAAVEGPNRTAASGAVTNMRACPPDGVDVFAQFNSTAVYQDDVESYSTVEPAIDLTASSPLAFAWQATNAAVGSPPQTVVSITFDDGYADQIGTLSILNDHGMHAAYYVNSGSISDSAHLSWQDLADLAAAGNEIAGHTVDHVNIKKLKTAEARYQVCQDRDNLMAQGFAVTSFAYPFGSFDAGSELVVADCGYNSGRGVAGVDDTKNWAETIPPLDPYATRVPPSFKQGNTVETIESYIVGAEQHGGGWVQLVFHHLCDGCDAYSVSPAIFTALLDWLQPRAANGTIVKTVGEVIGGSVKPPVQP